MYKFLNIHSNELYPVFKMELTKLFTEKVDRYEPTITFLTLNQKRKFEKYCRSNINKNITKELIPPKTPQPPKPPKIEKIIFSSSQPPKSSIIDNIISNKENKKKLEKSLKIIKSLI